MSRRRWRTVCYEWSHTDKRFRLEGGPWHDALATALAWADWLHAQGYRVRIESDGHPRKLHEFAPDKPALAYSA